MNKYLNGIVSGFIATFVLSILMVIKGAVGIMPQFDVIKDMSTTIGTTSIAAGWFLHFILGSVLWGVLFALTVDFFKGGYWLRGVQFGLIIWLLMMIVFMPFVGNGFFASNLGAPAFVMTLVLHIIFGFVLGVFYEVFRKKGSSTGV